MGSTRADVEYAINKLNIKTDALSDGLPAHRVRITKGFWLGECAVTNAQYRRYCEKTGAGFPKDSDQGDRHPVDDVNWTVAQAYCKHYGLSLPAEAQWEYAARGLEDRRYPWANEWDSRKCCNEDDQGPSGQTFPVVASPKGVLVRGVGHGGERLAVVQGLVRQRHLRQLARRRPPRPGHRQVPRGAGRLVDV